MAYAFQQDVPINMDIYRAIMERLGDSPPEGLIVHLVLQREEGLRYIDVWESQAAHQRFVDERLHPVIGSVLRNAGFTEMPPEPHVVVLDVTDVWGTIGPLMVLVSA